MNKSSSKILVIAAHPDDEVLGCGGTIARYAQEGCICRIVIMAEGITSRDESRDPKKHKHTIAYLKGHARKASEILGVGDIEFYSFPDNRMDSVDLLDIVKVVEKAVDSFEPDIIFTHHYGDLNIDHRIVASAVETATRPAGDRIVPELYSFEVLSSTEWLFSDSKATFHPNCFVDISRTIEKKIEAFMFYSSESRQFPHPRSREAIRAFAHMRGSQSGCNAAEAFHLIRKIDRLWQ